MWIGKEKKEKDRIGRVFQGKNRTKKIAQLSANASPSASAS